MQILLYIRFKKRVATTRIFGSSRPRGPRIEVKSSQMSKSLVREVKFDVESDDFLRAFFFSASQITCKKVKHFTCRTNNDPLRSDG